MLPTTATTPPAATRHNAPPPPPPSRRGGAPRAASRACVAAAVAAAVVAGCAGAGPEGGAAGGAVGGAQSRGQVGTPVPLTFDRADATSLSLTGYMGRAVLLVAVLMDDLASQATARNAEQLARAHPEDLAVVVIVGDHYPYSRLRQLAQVYKGVLELTRSEVVLADDDLREGRSPLGEIEHVPTIFLINRAGRIARRLEGYQGTAQLAALVAPALPPRTGPEPAPAAASAPARSPDPAAAAPPPSSAPPRAP